MHVPSHSERNAVYQCSVAEVPLPVVMSAPAEVEIGLYMPVQTKLGGNLCETGALHNNEQ